MLPATEFRRTRGGRHGTAVAQGELWGTRARDWAELQEPNHVPYFEAVLDAAGEVPTPFEFADLDAAWRAIAAAGPGTRALREAGEERARATISAAYAPFRRADGSYRLENVFRYVVARA